MLPIQYDLLLQLQRALFNMIPPQLRAITVEINENKKEIQLSFFCDCEITPELFDIASIVEAEIDLAYLGYSFTGNLVTYLPFPQPIPCKGWCAFLRKEEIIPEFKKLDKSFLLNQVPPLVTLQLEMQEALLGKVSPRLRMVSVDVDVFNQLLRFYFFYDGLISSEDWRLANEAIHLAGSSFSKYQLESHIQRVDFPRDMDAHGCTGVYRRQEVRYGITGLPEHISV